MIKSDLKKQILKTAVAVLFIMCSGCVSMSSLQTARTLAPEESRHNFGGGIYESKQILSGVESNTYLPYAEYSYRHGLMDNLDGGLKLTIIGSYAVDIKYSLYSAEKFAAAVGFGLGYLSYEISAGDSKQEVNFLDFALPFYLSYDFTPSAAIYLGPKYIYRSISGSQSENQSLVGTSLGLKIGEKSGVFLETSFFKGPEENYSTQYNVSYFW